MMYAMYHNIPRSEVNQASIRIIYWRGWLKSKLHVSNRSQSTGGTVFQFAVLVAHKLKLEFHLLGLACTSAHVGGLGGLKDGKVHYCHNLLGFPPH